MKAAENIEQHERKRHTELDNIFQVMTWRAEVAALGNAALDQNKPIDVFKFALAIGDGINKEQAPAWLKTTLKGQANTFANRLHCLMSNNTVTVKFLNENKIVTAHPEMRTY